VHPFLEHSLPLAFAHQGGGLEAVENTWPAFEHAVELGYHYLETDAQATSDGVLIAFHDDTLDRVTDRTGPIREQPWSEVSRARTRVGGHELVRIDELVERWPQVRFNIDAKGKGSVEPLVEIVRRLERFDSVCLASFSDSRIRRLRRRAAPARICTNTGRWATVALRLGSFLPIRLPFASDAAQVPTRVGPVPVVDRRFVAAAHRNGLQVHVWTIDDRDEMQRLLDLGVDGLMTDRPGVLKDVLVARGEWVGA